MHELKFDRFLSILSGLIFIAACANAQNGREEETTPSAVAESMINKPAFVENARGENFCWHARVGMNQFIDSLTFGNGYREFPVVLK